MQCGEAGVSYMYEFCPLSSKINSGEYWRCAIREKNAKMGPHVRRDDKEWEQTHSRVFEAVECRVNEFLTASGPRSGGQSVKNTVIAG